MYRIKNLKDGMDLLMITGENKLHYLLLKILTDLCKTIQKIKIKNAFENIV